MQMVHEMSFEEILNGLEQNRKTNTRYKIDDLLDVMRALRDPDNGCPWDIEQNFASIAPYTLEEAYEVVDAIHLGSRGVVGGDFDLHDIGDDAVEGSFAAHKSPGPRRDGGDLMRPDVAR